MNVRCFSVPHTGKTSLEHMLRGFGVDVEHTHDVVVADAWLASGELVVVPVRHPALAKLSEMSRTKGRAPAVTLEGFQAVERWRLQHPTLTTHWLNAPHMNASEDVTGLREALAPYLEAAWL